ncbi:MAG: hypothetical protein DRH30_00850 [Deltaproteobacteria bacterium]|nr:MAG: hypothetical protein DRH30_00850 [Deltaproteobacteria bacterium]
MMNANGGHTMKMTCGRCGIAAANGVLCDPCYLGVLEDNLSSNALMAVLGEEREKEIRDEIAKLKEQA